MHPNISLQLAAAHADDLMRHAQRVNEASEHRQRRHRTPRVLWRYFTHGHEAHQQSVRGTDGRAGGARAGVAGGC